MHPVSATICAITLLLPFFWYLQICTDLLALRADYQREIDRLQPRVARLEGLLNNEDMMRESAGQLRVQLARIAYPPDLDRAFISATLQKELKQLFSDAGMSVSNSQVLPLRTEDNFDRIIVRYTVTGSIDGLDGALRLIAEFSPRVLVETLEVWPKAARRGQPDSQTVTATLQLLSLGVVQ